MVAMTIPVPSPACVLTSAPRRHRPGVPSRPRRSVQGPAARGLPAKPLAKPAHSWAGASLVAPHQVPASAPRLAEPAPLVQQVPSGHLRIAVQSEVAAEAATPESLAVALPAQSSPQPLTGEALAKMPVRFSGGATASREAGPVRRILCYGDSLTAGFCNFGFTFEPYGRTLAEALATAGTRCEVSVCGLSGRTAQEMIEEKDSASFTDCADVHHVGEGLARVVGQCQPDLVLILAGTNDLVYADIEGQEVNAGQIFARVQELHELCHRLGCPTIALVPPCGLFGEQRKVQRELAPLMAGWAKATEQVLGIYDVEKLSPRSLNSPFWDPDDLHMSAAGQRMLGQNLALRIPELLPADPAPSRPATAPSQLAAAPPQPDPAVLQPDPLLSALAATKPPAPPVPPQTAPARPDAQAQRALAAASVAALFDGDTALLQLSPALPRPALSTLQLPTAALQAVPCKPLQRAHAASSAQAPLKAVLSPPRPSPAVSLPIPNATTPLAFTQQRAAASPTEGFRTIFAPVQTMQLPGTNGMVVSTSFSQVVLGSPIGSPRVIGGVSPFTGIGSRARLGSELFAPSYSRPAATLAKSAPASPRLLTSVV